MTAPIRYAIAPEVLQQFPGYCRGVVWVRGARNGASVPAVTALLRAAEAEARQRVTGNVAEHPRIAAWREAYRRFGAKPAEHRSAIEALLRRVLKPDDLPAINLLVDIGTLVSVRHLLPAGVHPIPPDGQGLTLRHASEGDRFLPAGSDTAETPAPGEVVFASGAEVLTRRWTWRQAAGTQTLPETSDVFFNVDGLAPCTRAEVEAAMADVEALVRAHAGGEITSVVLDAGRPQADLP
ncbi:B3/4 domain-containing protein [Ramlibacter sp.]|uniref:B3/B4 domain-containing protein n=1 Tax=Ramlibacter sp. TaxID=1917967 RepID=UPI0035B49A36